MATVSNKPTASALLESKSNPIVITATSNKGMTPQRKEKSIFVALDLSWGHHLSLTLKALISVDLRYAMSVFSGIVRVVVH